VKGYCNICGFVLTEWSISRYSGFPVWLYTEALSPSRPEDTGLCFDCFAWAAELAPKSERSNLIIMNSNSEARSFG